MAKNHFYTLLERLHFSAPDAATRVAPKAVIVMEENSEQ